MSYSADLIEKAKNELGILKDAEFIGILPKCTKSIISEIKSGKRNLTEEQALWIAEKCKLDAGLVLVELAAECAKSEKAQSIWSELAKKMKAAANIALVAAFFTVSGLSGHYLPQRIKNSP